MMTFYVYDPTPDSGDPGNAFGLYAADTPDGARRAFMNEWDYDEDYAEALVIRAWQACEKCNSTGLIPMPGNDPLRELYDDDEFCYFCPVCVLGD